MPTPYRVNSVPKTVPSHHPKYRCWVSRHPWGVTDDDGVGFTSNWFVLCWLWSQITVWNHLYWAVDIQTLNKHFQPNDPSTGRELIRRAPSWEPPLETN